MTSYCPSNRKQPRRYQKSHRGICSATISNKYKYTNNPPHLFLLHLLHCCRYMYILIIFFAPFVPLCCSVEYPTRATSAVFFVFQPPADTWFPIFIHSCPVPYITIPYGYVIWLSYRFQFYFCNLYGLLFCVFLF